MTNEEANLRINEFIEEENKMMKLKVGKVKWFNDAKGYGFITTKDGAEFFVHYSNIIMNGRKTLKEGQKVSFNIKDTGKGHNAIDVEVI